ncbi:MAG TPA: RidA family protein [Bacteroidales bacterium]|nr:RidA family protein [Bacteroidales bacterium]
MQYIHTSNAPAPAGHYSQAVVHNGLVFVSGQLSIDPVSRRPLHLGAGEQLKLALENLERIVIAAGSSRQKILKCTVFVADISLWPEANEAYAAFFGDHKPARSIVPTGSLHHGLLVEVEAIAATD